MNVYPKRPERAQTGSTLKHPGWTNYWKKLVAAQSRPLVKDSREYLKQRQSLLSKADLRAGRELVGKARDDWHRTNLLALVKSPQSKDEARTKLNRRLSRSIRGFSEIQKLKKAHLRQHGKLTEVVLTGIPDHRGQLTWGEVLPADPDAVEFLPPYAQFDVHTVDIDGLIVQDDSFVLLDAGHLVQNYVFEHNESDWGFYNPALFANHMASCGVDFTMPQAGRLHVVAELQNIYNRINFSVSDNFGFSHSDLDVRVKVFVVFLRPNGGVLFYSIDLITTSVSSGGDDLSRAISDLDNSVGYAADVTTVEILPAGETLTVLAGAHIRIDSDTDDMDAHVKPTFWWQLRSLQIAVV